MVSSELWFGSTKSFYNDVATRSLRFNDADSPYMTFDPASATSGTWTLSFWVKRGTLGSTHVIFSSGVVNARGHIYFTSADKLQVQPFNSSGQAGYTVTDMVFRDCSAWYHIVISANSLTTSNIATALVIYVNGEVATRTTNSGSSATGGDRLGDAQAKRIGEYAPDSGSHFDGYLCDFNWVDGTALNQNNFGEFKNGVWIAKDPDVSDYGSAGYRLKFDGTGTSTSSGTVSSPTNIGDDSSGNNNHWGVSGLASIDSNIPDSPENNFCILNPVGRRYGQSYVATFSEGNLKFASGGNATNVFGSMAINQIASQGGVYFELRFDSIDSVRTYFGVIGDSGINNTNAYSNSGGYTFPIKGMLSSVPRGYFTTDTDASNSVDLTANTAFSNGDVAGIAILSDGKFFVHRNGTYLNDANGNTGNPSTGANPIATIDLTEGDWLPYLGYSSSYSANFGQDGSFSNQETSGGNSDANGIGDFMFAVPTNCLALCSSNMAEPTISPNSSNGTAGEFFNTVLYNGNSGTQSITGVGFQPDWVWTKIRSSTNNHYLLDSVRGGFNRLNSNNTNQEATSSNAISSFDSDGYTIAGTQNEMNLSGQTYVSWNWKANGATPSKTYKVVVVSDSGNKYRFRNSADSATFAQSAVTLDLQEGGTYVFDWSDSTAQGHPIRFSTTSDGTHGGGSEYTTGVVKDDSAYKTTITVASSAPQLYYYCQNHSGMGGQVNTNATFGSTNFDGSILSVSNTNTTSGFSIVSYTGNATAGATVGHGLGAVPKWYFVKSRSSTTGWAVYHQQQSASPQNGYLLLNLTDAFYDIVVWNDTAPTSSVFSLAGSGYSVNNASATYVAYCFAEVEGYSKFGSYKGNDISDGSFVYLGFRPSWVMIKRTDSANNWNIIDVERDPINVMSNYINANESNAEASYNFWDFTSNGFKIRNTGSSFNGSVVYMAFAEQPFKFANAR